MRDNRSVVVIVFDDGVNSLGGVCSYLKSFDAGNSGHAVRVYINSWGGYTLDEHPAVERDSAGAGSRDNNKSGGDAFLRHDWVPFLREPCAARNKLTVGEFDAAVLAAVINQFTEFAKVNWGAGAQWARAYRGAVDVLFTGSAFGFHDWVPFFFRSKSERCRLR